MKPASSVQKKAIQDLRKKNDLIANNYRSAFVQGFAVLSVSIALYYLLALVIAHLYHPDLSAAFQLAKDTLISPGSAAPKPVERVLFTTAILFFPVSAFVLFGLARRYLGNVSPKSLRIMYGFSSIAGMIAIFLITYSGLAAPNPFANNPQNSHDAIAKTNLDFYFISTFMYDNFLWYCVLLFPAILIYFLYRDKLPSKLCGMAETAEKIFTYVFCSALAIIIFFIFSFKFPYTMENKYDFNAVYYPVVQVYNGAPLLVDHFTNLYGLYPHFVVPVLKLIGLSVWSFSGIMAFLVSMCFVFLLLFFRKMIDNKLLILFGVTTVFFNCLMYGHIITPFDAYFAMCPIRWIVPFSLISYAVWYLKSRSKQLYYASFFIYALGILWTPDFGLLSFLSLIAFYSFLEFENQELPTVMKKVALHLIVATLSLAAVLFIYSLYIRVFFSAFPDLTQITTTMKTFYVIGAGMLPTPSTYHPWMLVALVYLIGISVSVYHIVNRSVSPRSAVVFLLTAIGVASFQYYLGRSHNWNLFGCSPWCFILMTIFADDLLTIIKKTKLFHAAFASFTFALSFSFFQTVYAYDKIGGLIYEKESKGKNTQYQTDVVENAMVIRNAAREKERVLIFSANYLQGIYYGLSHTAAAINPGFEDPVLKTNYERFLSFLIKNDTTKVFFDAGSFRFYDNEIPVFLSSLYDIRQGGGDDGRILCLSKKEENRQSSFLIMPDKNCIMHELYDKNFSNKISYAEGNKGTLSLGTQFSIQVIFKPVAVPATIYTKWQTVFSNRLENGGFVLMEKIDDKAHYLFTIADGEIDCPVDIDKWNYLSFEMNGSLLRVFKNGRIFGKIDTHGSYRNSGLPLFIGSYNKQGGFFWGAIKELEISNCLLDEKNIGATWKKAAEIL